jgi:hypothetical protein
MTARIFNIFVVIFIVIATLFVYRGIFDLWFTDIDTFPLITTGRVGSINDILDIVTSPLMQGQMPNALFYRPLASFTWGIDELIWGMNPLGYHLTDLCIHIANSLLLLFFLRETYQRLSPNGGEIIQSVSLNDWVAFIAVLIFAIHPITMEVVPAIARRPDLMLGLFMLLMLRSLGQALHTNKKAYTVLAATYCFLGIASKDAAVVLPGIAVAFVFCFSTGQTFTDRVKQCLALCWPLVLAAVIFMGLRTIVLGGMGGYAGARTFTEAAFQSIPPYLCGVFIAGNINACADTALSKLVIGLAVITTSLILLCWRGRKAARGTTFDHLLRIFAFAVLSLLGFFLLHTSAGKAASLRTLYTPLIFLSMVLGWALVLVPQAVFARGKLFNMRLIARLVHSAAGIMLLFIIFGILQGAWTGKYIEEWKLSSEVARVALSDFAQHIESLPPKSVLYLVNFPFRVGIDPLILRERPILLEHSVQGYADFIFPDKNFEVVGLSIMQIDINDPAQLASEIRFQPDPPRLKIKVGQNGSARRRAWFNPYAKKTPWHDNTYVNNPAENQLVIELNPNLDLTHNVGFYVYAGGRVERQPVTPWVTSYTPEVTTISDP